jgi:hypothetical protein
MELSAQKYSAKDPGFKLMLFNLHVVGDDVSGCLVLSVSQCIFTSGSFQHQRDKKNYRECSSTDTTTFMLFF